MYCIYYVPIYDYYSMGGALAVHCALNIANLCALCVIDVVEGSAMDALSSMQTFLRSRPDRFQSVQHAIQWWYVLKIHICLLYLYLCIVLFIIII